VGEAWGGGGGWACRAPFFCPPVPTTLLLPAWDVLARQDAAADAADAARFARLDAAAPQTPGGPAPASLVDPSAHRLTRALLASVALHGAVVVTWANVGYADFVRNWVAHARGAGMTNFLVGALDDALLAALVAAATPCFAMHAGLPEGDFGWGSASFHEMGRAKAGLVRAVNGLGFDVLVSDVDTAWLLNPFPLLARLPEADLLVSSDNLRATAGDAEGGGGVLEAWPEAGAAFNIGVFLARVSAAPFIDAWDDALAAGNGTWDQAVFNEMLREGIDLTTDRPDNLFRAANGTVLMGVLPVDVFASGHTFFVQRMAERRGVAPTVVHATFQFSGTPGKRHRLRERRLWAPDDRTHYDPEGGLLALDIEVGGLVAAAAAAATGAAPPTNAPHPLPPSLARFHAHFTLVHAQLRHLRAGLALARALNRTLVLPRLWCGADRWWAPHDGRIPGAEHPSLPFRCPADHVLDLEAWAAPATPPRPRFRESGLLTHPRTPARVKADVVRVSPCEPGSHLGCGGGGGGPSAEAQPGWVRLRAGLDARAIAAALAPYSHRKVLTFTDAASTFGGFGDPGEEAAFADSITPLASIWCCVDAGPGHPGHVWYDWMAAVGAAHTDRHGRAVGEEWAPVLGP